jgi:gamma-glutamylputrescine oxidase
MHEQVLWLAGGETPRLPALRGQVRAGVAVVGGGMAGLAAAQWLRERAGCDVVLLEAGSCGGGATGRSSGFITPDSELQVADLVRRFGAREGRTLWLAARGACDHIRDNVRRFDITCDLVEADCLYLGAGRMGQHTVRVEHGTRQGLDLDSRIYEGEALATVLGTRRYRAGVRYGGTFAIDAHAYAQGLKRALVAAGVRVFEDSPVVSLGGPRVETAHGSVLADRVIVCLDRFAPELGVARDTWHAQTFLIASAPLDAATQRSLFPDGPLLAWDTDLIYQYFRLTGDGRLLVGGGRLRETYAREHHDSDTPRRLQRWARRTFPALRDLQFECYWPGLIGVTRDLLPLAGPTRLADATGSPEAQQAVCAAGLPWSVLAGQAAARSAVAAPEPMDRHLRPERHFHLQAMGRRLPPPLTFPLSHLIYKW